jgi:hypothetical protein
MLSTLYSQIALPLIAQIMGRVVHGSLLQRQNYASITILEKSIAFAIMAGLGGTASFLVLNQNIMPPGLFSALILMVGAIITTFITCYFVFFNVSEQSQIISLFSKITQLGILRIIGLSLAIQVGILLAYTILALQFVPNANIGMLICGFAIVVLATAVPFGIGGWGVREAAAAGVFLALGLPPEIGVIVGLLYGLLNLIILTISVYVLRHKTKPTKTSSFSGAKLFEKVDFWPVTFFLFMILLPFQMRLPIASGLITLNSADVLALIVMFNFVLANLLKGTIKFIWRDHLMWIGIAGVIAMLIIGWIVGYLRFGSNEWATASRLVGIISVLSYLVVGAAMRHLLTQQMVQKLALILAFSIVMSAGIKFVAYNIFGFESSLFFNWFEPIHGFIADRNAFCFMAALSSLLLIFTVQFSPPNNRVNGYVSILMSIIFVLMITSGSRSGFGAAIILAIWMFAFLPRHIPKMITSILVTVLMLEFSNSFNAVPVQLLDARIQNSFMTIGSERLFLFLNGYQMFLDYPFFGGGLGASINETGLVIHNLYMWVLGEMGLVGVALSLPLIIAFFRTGWQAVSYSPQGWMKNTDFHFYVIFIIICGGFSLVQDIAYQRILWFLIGFMMAQNVTNGQMVENGETKDVFFRKHA